MQDLPHSNQCEIALFMAKKKRAYSIDSTHGVRGGGSGYELAIDFIKLP